MCIDHIQMAPYAYKRPIGKYKKPLVCLRCRFFPYKVPSKYTKNLFLIALHLNGIVLDLEGWRLVI
jgi:hypothetical protein